MIQRGIQATDFGVMIGRWSPDSQYGKLDRHPANVGYPFFRFTNEVLTRDVNTKQGLGKTTDCYFRSNEDIGKE